MEALTLGLILNDCEIEGEVLKLTEGLTDELFEMLKEGDIEGETEGDTDELTELLLDTLKEGLTEGLTLELVPGVLGEGLPEGDCEADPISSGNGTLFNPLDKVTFAKYLLAPIAVTNALTEFEEVSI